MSESLNNTNRGTIKTTRICQGCWENMSVPIAIRGPFSLLFRPFGIRKSQMHPNLCTICESMFTRVKKEKQISIATTIMFADLRGYTGLSETLPPSAVNEILHRFYDRCSAAVWEQDGIVNKFIGDAVLAIFNFPMSRADHARRAVRAAVRLQEDCRGLQSELGGTTEPIGVGIGIHTGVCSMGEVGTSYKDFTAIGPVVNIASRIQGAATPGEILVSADVYNQVADDYPGLPGRSLTLKGIANPVTGYALA